MRRRAPLRSRGQGTFSTSISHTSLSLRMKRRLGIVDRHADHGLRRDERRRGIGRCGVTPAARQRGAGQLLSRRMAAWRPRLIFVFGPIRISNFYDASLCCLCVISFAHSKVHNGHEGRTADRNTCWRDSPFELQQNVCISACPALAVGWRVSSSDGKLISGRARALEPINA